MKLGVVGSGFIVTSFAKALGDLKNITPVAMWTMESDVENARGLAESMNISKIYTDYEAFLQDPDIEVVYIGIINSEHYTFARSALITDKPVILEKPFTSNAKQAEELIQIAKERHLMLVEAVSFLFSPNYKAFQEQSKRIRNLKLIECRYIQYSRRYDYYLNQTVLPAFSRELSGGALYDINIYNLHLVIGLYGMPKKVSYWANTGFNGIDTSGVAILDYGDFKAVCIGAKDARNSAETILTGQNGILKLNGPPNLFTSFQYEIDGEKGEYFDTSYSTHMVYEFREFERMYREDDWETIVKCMDHTLSVMRVAEALRKDAGIVFPCDEKEFV